MSTSGAHRTSSQHEAAFHLLRVDFGCGSNPKSTRSCSARPLLASPRLRPLLALPGPRPLLALPGPRPLLALARPRRRRRYAGRDGHAQSHGLPGWRQSFRPRAVAQPRNGRAMRCLSDGRAQPAVAQTWNDTAMTCLGYGSRRHRHIDHSSPAAALPDLVSLRLKQRHKLTRSGGADSAGPRGRGDSAGPRGGAAGLGRGAGRQGWAAGRGGRAGPRGGAAGLGRGAGRQPPQELRADVRRG
ncbi:hypothetical protein FB565_002590 [Actinoplanes lutulentus]|nr:hypothetical protein [Actinoplanes lutulentus]